MPPILDPDDVKIISVLQRDATRSPMSISEQIGLSQEQYNRHLARLEANGILEQRVALIDNERIGLPLTVFAFVRTEDDSQDWAAGFTPVVRDIPEVVEFYQLAGDKDYILKMMVSDVAHYERIHQKLITQFDIADMTAHFASDKLKFTTELPLSQAMTQDLKA